MEHRNKIIGQINFSISERKVFLFCIDNAICIAGILYYFHLLGQPIGLTFYFSSSFFLVLNSTFNAVFKTYDIPIASSIQQLNLILFVQLLVFSFLFLTPGLIPRIPDSKVEVLFLVMFLPLSVTLWRFLYIRVIHQPVLFTNVLIFGRGRCIDFTHQHFDFESHAYRILGEERADKENVVSDDILEGFMRRVIRKQVNTVILGYDDLKNIPNNVNQFVDFCSIRGVEIYNYLRFYESVNAAIPIRQLGNNIFLHFPFTRSNYNLIYKGIHRTIDVLSSLVGLFFLALLLPVVYILNVFFNPGPLFFKQYRVGKGGEEVLVHKLRSMVVDAEKKTGAVMAQKNDARITRFGKVLRKFRIDELPQFWTVLKGDMSLIGPRPERKVFVDQLKKKIMFYDMRHMVKPGITGWAQVRYKYGENLEDSYRKLEYDLYYIKHRSLLLDLKIIFETVNTIIFSRGQ